MGESKWEAEIVSDKMIWQNDLSKIELWPLYTDNICKVLQRTWLRKTVSNTGREKWTTTTSEVIFNANDEFYFNASYFVRTCWTSIQNTVYCSFLNRKAELVIQQTNYNTIKNNDRIYSFLLIRPYKNKST